MNTIEIKPPAKAHDNSVISDNPKVIADPMARIKNILDDYEVILSTNNITYLHNTSDTHEPVYAVNSNKANTIIRERFYQQGITLRNSDLKEVNELLAADAAMKNKPRKVHFYVAGVDEGIENDC